LNEVVETIFMKVSHKTEGDTVYFVISEADPKYHDAIRHLYYEEENNDFVKSFPSNAPHVEKCYNNFERRIEQIILQMAGFQSVPWDKALLAYLKKIGGEDIDWWLCGSGALAVRGIDITPHDIDVITDEAGAYRIGEILQDHLFEPIVDTQGWICRVFGKAFLYAAIDIAGGINECVDKPEPSDFGPVAASRLETVKWRGYELRVPPLDLQLQHCERRGLTDRTAKIRSMIIQDASY
jgi:hypothetical protein